MSASDMESEVEDLDRMQHWPEMSADFFGCMRQYRQTRALSEIEGREDLDQMSMMDAEYCAEHCTLELNVYGREGIFNCMTAKIRGKTTSATTIFHNMVRRFPRFEEMLRTPARIAAGMDMYGTEKSRIVVITFVSPDGIRLQPDAYEFRNLPWKYSVSPQTIKWILHTFILQITCMDGSNFWNEYMCFYWHLFIHMSKSSTIFRTIFQISLHACNLINHFKCNTKLH